MEDLVIFYGTGDVFFDIFNRHGVKYSVNEHQVRIIRLLFTPKKVRTLTSKDKWFESKEYEYATSKPMKDDRWIAYKLGITLKEFRESINYLLKKEIIEKKFWGGKFRGTNTFWYLFPMTKTNNVVHLC